MDAVPQKYICVICEKVLRDARLTACCGQHFCDSCLTRWTDTGYSYGGRSKRKTCPHCRSEGFQSILNKEKIREINELRVRCTHRKKGCVWEGELGAAQQHLKSCDYVLVSCELFGWVVEHIEPLFPNDPFSRACFGLPIPENPFWGWGFDELPDCDFESYDSEVKETCNAKIERRHLREHQETECVLRRYTCKHCGYEDTYDAIAGSGRVRKEESEVKSDRNHYQDCSHFPLDCPNRCGAKNIKRRNIKSHRSKCVNEPVDCPFGGQACFGKVTRANVEAHKKDCDFRPYTCEYCGTVGTFSSITGQETFRFYQLLEPCHYDECEQFPVDCPNGCGEKAIKRRDMEAHKTKCPLEPVDCPFSHVGCAAHIPQKDMDSHCQENVQAHLLMMARSHRELSDRNKELLQKTEELTKRNRELTEKNEELSHRVEDLDGELVQRCGALEGEVARLDERLRCDTPNPERRNRGQQRHSRGNRWRRGGRGQGQGQQQYAQYALY